MDFDKLAQDIAELNVLKAHIKELSMIYQITEKQSAARWNNVPLDTYYHLPLIEWEKIRNKFHQDIENMFYHCREVENFHGVSKGTYANLPCSQWHDKYLEWEQSKEIKNE